MSAETQGRIEAGVMPISIGGVQQEFFVVGIPETNKAVAITGLVSDAEKHDESIADARRIAACWNACEGIPTDELEPGEYEKYIIDRGHEIGRLTAERDELLNALKRATNEAVADEQDDWFANALAAIAKAKGGA